MRFVFISTMEGAPWGGSEELWSQAAMRLCQQGHHVAASVYDWGKMVGGLIPLEKSGVTIHTRRTGLLGYWHSFRSKVMRRSQRHLRENSSWRWILKQRPDLVCVSDGGTFGGWTWMERCLNADIPYVSISQCNHEAWWPVDSDLERLIKLFSSARRCFFVSENNYRLCELQLGERLPHGEVVRNPFKVRYNATVPWPPPNTGYSLACVGRLEPAAKGQDLILALLSLEKWKNRNLKVRFYGGGPCGKGLQRLARQLNPGQVEFKGYVDDVESIWAENHGLVLPSRYEGLPLAVVEAMLCSRMVIVTDVAGNAEMIQAGRNGFVAAAAKWQLLDEAMEQAWQQRENWRQLGIRAREVVTQTIPNDPIALFCQKLCSACVNS